MILKNQIITNLKIIRLRIYINSNLFGGFNFEINKSQIARELEVDRRTVDKYINGYQRPKSRNSIDCITPTMLLSQNYFLWGINRSSIIGRFSGSIL
jgi:predicted regulator of amino acid metabolism with ACT domain